MLTIGSALSKGWRSGPEAFRAGHYKDLTETGNRARKVSGTQGTIFEIREENGRSRRDSHRLTHMAFMGYLSA